MDKALSGELPEGGESHCLNDRVHVTSCRYSDKTGNKINYISTNTYSIFMQLSAPTSSLFVATNHLSVFLQCEVIFHRSPSKVKILKTIFVGTCMENYRTIHAISCELKSVRLGKILSEI